MSRKVTLSGLRNQSHVVYAASWLRHAAAQHGPLALVVVDGGEGKRPQSIDRLRLISPEIEIVTSHSADRGDHDYVSIGTPGIKPWLRLRRAYPRDRFRTVTIDEGLGSFATWRQRRRAILREGGSEPAATVRAISRDIAARRMPAEQWRLFIHNADGWSISDAIAAEYRREGPRTTATRDVVYLSQPWVELGSVPEEPYVAHITAVAEQVRSLGWRFRVRPHPTEQHDRYAPFDLIASRGPAELDPDVLAATALVGESTTALLNLSAIHGMPAVQIRGPVPQFTQEWLSDAQRSLFRQFLGGPVETEHVAARLASLTGVGDA
ncbi:MAG: hypothetical protein AAFY28_04525 [Actinomycetota bacterium]